MENPNAEESLDPGPRVNARAEKARLECYEGEITLEHIPQVSEWQPAFKPLDKKTLTCESSLWLSPHGRESAPGKYLYKGKIAGTEVRIYEHCSQASPVMLFRPVIDPVLKVECSSKDDQRTDVTLATFSGNIVFKQTFPTRQNLLVAHVQDCARKALCLCGFMSKSAKLQMVCKLDAAAPLSRLAVLVRGSEAAPGKQPKRSLDESSVEGKKRKRSRDVKQTELCQEPGCSTDC